MGEGGETSQGGQRKTEAAVGNASFKVLSPDSSAIVCASCVWLQLRLPGRAYLPHHLNRAWRNKLQAPLIYLPKAPESASIFFYFFDILLYTVIVFICLQLKNVGHMLLLYR